MRMCIPYLVGKDSRRDNHECVQQDQNLQILLVRYNQQELPGSPQNMECYRQSMDTMQMYICICMHIQCI